MKETKVVCPRCGHCFRSEVMEQALRDQAEEMFTWDELMSLIATMFMNKIVWTSAWEPLLDCVNEDEMGVLR